MTVPLEAETFHENSNAPCSVAISRSLGSQVLPWKVLRSLRDWFQEGRVICGTPQCHSVAPLHGGVQLVMGVAPVSWRVFVNGKILLKWMTGGTPMTSWKPSHLVKLISFPIVKIVHVVETMPCLPPMPGDGCNTAAVYGDDCGMVYDIVLTTVLWNSRYVDQL